MPSVWSMAGDSLSQWPSQPPLAHNIPSKRYMAVFLTVPYCWTFGISPTIINNSAKNIFVCLIIFTLAGYFFRRHFQKWDYWVKAASVFKALDTYWLMVWGKDNPIQTCAATSDRNKPHPCNFTSTVLPFFWCFNSFHATVSHKFIICVFFHLNYLSKLPVFFIATLEARKLEISSGGRQFQDTNGSL